MSNSVNLFKFKEVVTFNIHVAVHELIFVKVYAFYLIVFLCPG